MNWIELVDAGGQLLTRRPGDAVPCTIGSARDNTLVVDGPDILPYHARIDANADGSLSVTALGGHPGLHRPGAPERHPTLLLTRTAAIAIGGAQLRLVPSRDALDGLAAALAEEESVEPWRALAARRDVQWALAVATLLAGAAFSWFTVPTRDRSLTAVVVAIILLMAVAAWAGIFALVGRLRHGEARFGQHFAVAVVMTVVSLVVSELSSWQQFLQPGAPVMTGLLVLLTTLVAGVALYAQLRVYGPQHRERHLRIAAAATALFLVLAAGVTRVNDTWSNTLDFSVVLKPWPVNLTPARGVDSYGESLSKLEQQLEADQGD